MVALPFKAVISLAVEEQITGTLESMDHQGDLVPAHWMSLKERKQSHTRNIDFMPDTKHKLIYCASLSLLFLLC